MEFLELRKLLLASGERKTRQQMWHEYLSFAKEGDVFLEFGVWNGCSISYMAHVCPDNAFHGFDSFVGLPEDWIKGRPKGFFATDKSKLKVPSNVALHEGWFHESLPSFLLLNPEEKQGIKFVHIDCDLGSSTKTVLDTIGPTLIENQAYLLFDEFYNYQGYEDHEFKAFLEFLQLTEAPFQFISRNIRHQQALVHLS